MIKLNANYLDFVYAIANRNLIYILLLPSILINDSSVLNIFQNNEISQELNQIAISNSNLTETTFYTDGSVHNFMTNQCSIGIS